MESERCGQIKYIYFFFEIVNWSYFITTRQWKNLDQFPFEIVGLVFGYFTFKKKNFLNQITQYSTFPNVICKELFLRKILQKSRDGIFKYEKLHFFYKESCALDKWMTLQYRNSNKYIKQK